MASIHKFSNTPDEKPTWEHELRRRSSRQGDPGRDITGLCRGMVNGARYTFFTALTM
jgi:hypothetical protein